MKLQIGQIVENKLSNGKVIVCRVVEFVESVGMYRLTDARETRDDAWLIEHNRTWAAPMENIGPHDGDCVICYKDGLVWLAGSQASTLMNRG
jgi:hypothetical protein